MNYYKFSPSFSYHSKESELVAILAVRHQNLLSTLQHVAHRRSSEVRHRAVDGHTVEKYIPCLHLHEYRLWIVEDTFYRFACKYSQQSSIA